MKEIERSKVHKFHRLLFTWYERHQRHLPWRETHDPYKILVSEVMLQQTQVSRVIPKYLAWIKQYPTAASLAGASAADILRLWSSLGYNRRAIYLKRAAVIIADKWNGRWPQTISELTKLPGVGRYTAGAILSFAFGKDVPLADINMSRVIGRIFVGPDWPKLSEKQMLGVIEKVLPQKKSRIFPHAVMDLGSALLANDPSLAEWRKEFPELFVADRRKSTKKESWQGSNRQIRGAILRRLQQKPSTTKKLADDLAVPISRLAELIKALHRDGLVHKVNNTVSLPL